MSTVFWLLTGQALSGCGTTEEPSIDVAAALSGADSLQVENPVPGVRHIYAWDRDGPWAINVLEFRTGVCDLEVKAVKAGPPLSARQRTSELGHGAVASVNADFFGIPMGTPVGPHVSDGRLLVGPGQRPVYAISSGRHWIGSASTDGYLAHGPDTLRLEQVNRRSGGQGTGDETELGAVLFDYWFGDVLPGDTGVWSIPVARIQSDGMVSRGIALSSVERGAAVRLDTATVAFAGDRAAGRWLERVGAGDTLVWTVSLRSADYEAVGPAEEAVGGFPVLVRRGEVAPEVDETSTGFGESPHPRTAVGFVDDGEWVILVTVDGRQQGFSEGMSLRKLAELMQQLGADHALNLDGGGSTAMVVSGNVVNRPSDAQGERAVGNALVVLGGHCNDH